MKKWILDIWIMGGAFLIYLGRAYFNTNNMHLNDQILYTAIGLVAIIAGATKKIINEIRKK